MNRTKSFIRSAAATAVTALIALIPVQALAQYRLAPGWYDSHGSLLMYHPSRGSPGPGNGPAWQGEPGDRASVWRHNRYRGNDPDSNIRRQMMRDR
jgi:hypothetical protein